MKIVVDNLCSAVKVSNGAADPHEVLRIIDDMEDSELSNEDDSETDEEAEISLAVTPVHSDSETETIDSIDPIPSGSGVVSTVVADGMCIKLEIMTLHGTSK